MQKIKVILVTELRVYGKEFRMIRYQARISLQTLANRMREKGWPYYPTKLFRLENQFQFALPPAELHDLFACMNVTLDIIST